MPRHNKAKARDSAGTFPPLAADAWAPAQGLRELLATLQELAQARDLATLQRRAAAAARELAGGDGATFVLRDGGYCHYVDEDAIGPLWKGRRFPLETCISGWAMLRGETAVVPDIARDDRIAPAVYRPTFVKSLVMVPVCARAPVAAIGVYWAEPHEAGAAEVELLQALAEAICIALDNVRRYQGLEQRIEERTAELAQRLAVEQAARQAAEQAHRARGEFLAGVGQALRAPLHDIIGLQELLLETLPDPEQAAFARRSAQCAELLLDRVDDLLDLVRIEAGQLALEDLEFLPEEVLHDVLASLQPAADAKGLRLSQRLRTPLPRVGGDALRLRQILLHLLGNAVKFTEKGRVAVECSMPARDDEAVWLRFVVSDTGIGIAAEALPRLLQRGAPVEGGTRRIGLGLALCKALVELMGGRIGVTSVEGRGSTFWVELPFRPVRADAEEAVPAARSGAPQARRPGHILLVEDNEVNRIVAARMLERLGYRVDVAVDGAEAVAASARTPYDLILMDFSLPVLSGLDACRAIRAREAETGQGATPVVAFTASGYARDRDACLEAGMDDVLGKPVQLRELALVVAKWLRPRELA